MKWFVFLAVTLVVFVMLTIIGFVGIQIDLWANGDWLREAAPKWGFWSYMTSQHLWTVIYLKSWWLWTVPGLLLSMVIGLTTAVSSH